EADLGARAVQDVQGDEYGLGLPGHGRAQREWRVVAAGRYHFWRSEAGGKARWPGERQHDADLGGPLPDAAPARERVLAGRQRPEDRLPYGDGVRAGRRYSERAAAFLGIAGGGDHSRWDVPGRRSAFEAAVREPLLAGDGGHARRDGQQDPDDDHERWTASSHAASSQRLRGRSEEHT